MILHSLAFLPRYYYKYDGTDYHSSLIRIDNAPEFVKLGKELKKDGIGVEATVPYTPSQNGVAKQLYQTLITKTQALFTLAKLLQ